MYTLNLSTGIVVLTATGVQVAPAQSLTEPSYLEYMAWLDAGNHPTEITSAAIQLRRITKLGFRNRFTTTEKVMLEMASLDNPTVTLQERQMAAMLRVFLKDLDNAVFIDLDRPEIQASLQQLVALGLLTAPRVTQIINDPISAVEAY